LWRSYSVLARLRRSPYIDRALCGKIVRTIVGGTTVFHDGPLR